MQFTLPIRFVRAFATLLAIGLTASWAVAKPVAPEEIKQRKEAPPKRLVGVDVDEHLEQKLPLDLEFTDETGKAVKLGDYFTGDVPVIVTLNYSNCPMLCSMQLTGLTEALKQIEWTVGEQFRIVTISIDPKETPETAARTEKRYVGMYGRPESAGGWAFLTGSEANIKAAAAAIGFKYNYNEVRDEYAHPAAFVVTTPDGRIARYLYGIEYHPKTVRLSLAESGEGKIGSTIDRLILYCFHYDETEGRYAPVARNIMTLGGGLTVLVLGGVLGSFWLAERRRKRKGTGTGGDAPGNGDSEELNPTRATS